MVGPRIVLSLACGILLMAGSRSFAQMAFSVSEIEGTAVRMFFGDFSGDGLKDALLMHGSNLSIHLQDGAKGFTRAPQRKADLAEGRSLVWLARVREKFDSLLVMTSEGVSELCFTNQSGPPIREQLITQRTILPESEKGRPGYFQLSADSGGGAPLLLVPAADGLQVWRHRDGWRQAQIIEGAIETRIRPFLSSPGYQRSIRLDLNLSDVNGDGRDDLLFSRAVAGRGRTYGLRLQTADGLFGSEQALTYTNLMDGETRISWIDLNRDGRVDLITSAVSDEPFFVPGIRSGKVLVAVHQADAAGRIPVEPQQVFRKSDWSSALPLVDVDGDGLVDMILGHISINAREGFRKVITAEEVDMNLRIHFNRPGSGFPKEMDSRRDVVLKFNREFMADPNRLYNDQFIRFDGDLNGDGKKDLLVHDRTGQISAYFFLSREKGFSARPDVAFQCPEGMREWQVEDLNGDGASDLVVTLQNPGVFRIFISPAK